MEKNYLFLFKSLEKEEYLQIFEVYDLPSYYALEYWAYILECELPYCINEEKTALDQLK